MITIIIAGNFRQLHHLLLFVTFLSTDYLFCINDYIEYMATFNALVKIHQIFLQYKVPGLGEIFVYSIYILYKPLHENIIVQLQRIVTNLILQVLGADIAYCIPVQVLTSIPLW